MRSERCLKLEAELREDQERVETLTEFIVRFEQNHKGREAIALRTVRAMYINKIRLAQAELDGLTEQYSRC